MLTTLLATLLASGAPIADDPAPGCRALAAAVAPAPLVADLAAALVAHGGAVRWSRGGAAGGRTVTVWLQPRPRGIAPTLHTDGEWRAALVAGALGWDGVVPDLRLAIGRDSASADVRVVWAGTLPAAAPGDPTAGALAALTAGRTTLEPDVAGHARVATVVLAARAGDGVAYQPRDARAVLRHEMGHALGLAHHRSPASVMAPLVSAEQVGEADRAVLRALYALPAGAPCRGT